MLTPTNREYLLRRRRKITRRKKNKTKNVFSASVCVRPVFGLGVFASTSRKLWGIQSSWRVNVVTYWDKNGWYTIWHTIWEQINGIDINVKTPQFRLRDQNVTHNEVHPACQLQKKHIFHPCYLYLSITSPLIYDLLFALQNTGRAAVDHLDAAIFINSVMFSVTLPEANAFWQPGVGSDQPPVILFLHMASSVKHSLTFLPEPHAAPAIGSPGATAAVRLTHSVN